MPVTIERARLPRLDPGLMARWKAVSTTIAADLLTGNGLADPAIRPLRPLGAGGRLVGRAVVAACEPPDFGAVPAAIDCAEPGDVIVIAANGDPGTAMIGDILGGAARRKGVLGVVCDGAVRDRAVLGGWPDFPVFHRAATARGPASKERGSVNRPAMIAGVMVRPGDLVVGDDDGVIFLAPERAQASIEAAERRAGDEERWVERLKAGEALCDVLGIQTLAAAAART